MADVPPPKLKAYLGKVKEDVLDGECNDANRLFQALVLMELVQRGVLPQASHQDDAPKIVEAIRSTAGKALLDGSSKYPKPLLAGASAVAGMVAEKCATLLDNQSLAVTGLGDAEARSKDVEDQRLVALISVSTAPADDQKSQLLQLAEGYFLRAASFQPDPPPMWKKALDAIALRGGDEEPLEAALPLDHLIGIAEAKNNAKRVSDLSLRQCESWLSSPMEGSSTVIAAAFVTPFRPKSPLQTNATKARKALKKCTLENLDEGGVLWYQLLALRIELVEENAAVEDLAQEKFTAAKNRGTNTSLQTCAAAARRSVLIESIDNDSALVSATDNLRASLLLRLDGGQMAVRKLEPGIFLLKTYVERLQERAQAGATTSLKTGSSIKPERALNAWVELAKFLQPVLQCVATAANWGTEEEAKKKENVAAYLSKLDKPVLDFFESCSTVAATTVWMTCGRVDDIFEKQHISFMYDLLFCLNNTITDGFKERKAAELKNTVVTTKAAESDVLRYSFESAVAAVNGVEQLNNNVDPSQVVTDEALYFSKSVQKYADYAARFGMPYLLFLNVWSGFQHSPWSRCNVTQARAIVKSARACLQGSTKEWGRQPTTSESLLLDVAEADMEGGFLVGGLGRTASKLYHNCIEQSASITRDDLKQVIRAHSKAGLSRLAMAGYDVKQEDDKEGKTITDLCEEFARCSLDEADKLVVEQGGGLYLNTTASIEASKAFHKSLARQLVADSLVRAGQPNGAEAFLEAAVQETPQDFDAALALGTFRLRMSFFPVEGQAASSEKAAQTQLLKAAKLNSSKSSPFALLGYWYERKNDVKRAIGCYSKALLLDPSHPVAGRGIVRLKPYSEVQKLCDDATNANSPVNGWAWKAVGRNKAMNDGDDNMAAICFQEALRCMDISTPHVESMSPFFAVSIDPETSTTEVAEVWSELAGCYWRLGRYTAAIRAFDSAWSTSRGFLPATVLTSWAQVQLELGLVDDAEEKFGLALEQGGKSVLAVAAYGQGCALLSVAKRDANDGKVGSAYSTLTKAIEIVKSALMVCDEGKSSSQFRCAMKLLGDLFTFGATIPPDVFGDQTPGEEDRLTRNMAVFRSQIDFIAEGERSYQSAEAACTDEDEILFRAALACDVGTNILLQAQVLSILHGEGHGTESNLSLTDTMLFPDVRERFNQSAEAFKRSIRSNPLFAPAWCGFGCAVAASEPLLAQHALARAIELDKALPDSWANLGFLYAARHAFTAASGVMDELTQVADTPMMWICRAAMLEREAVEQSEDSLRVQRLSRAADAYRAALQVTKEPVALLGIGMTCCAAGDEETKRMSQAYLSEFDGATASRSVGASVLQKTLTIDDCLNKKLSSSAKWKDDAIQENITGIAQLSKAASELFPRQSSVSELVPESKDGHADLDLIAELCSVIDKKASQGEETSKARPLQLEIVLDPTNGKLWLDLARSLTKDLLRMKGNKKKRLVLQTIESANVACDRAAKVLCAQTASSAYKVDASDAAEALALSYCSKEVEKELLENIKNPPDVHPANPYDIQRALFMCPDNRLAREVVSRTKL